MRIRLATSLLILAAPCAAQDAGEAGRRAFDTHCAACHALDPAAPPMAGPSLAGLVGRRVAADAAFGYSPVLQRAGRAGRVWDIPMLDEFLADPEAMSRANKRFHRQIHLASHNRFLVQQLDLVHRSMALLATTSLAAAGRSEAALAEHDAIVRAIEAGEGERAQQALSDHISKAFETRLKLDSGTLKREG